MFVISSISLIIVSVHVGPIFVSSLERPQEVWKQKTTMNIYEIQYLWKENITMNYMKNETEL